MKSLTWTMRLLEDVLKSKRFINPDPDETPISFVTEDSITFGHGFVFHHVGPEVSHDTRLVQNMNPEIVKKILDLIRQDLNEREALYKKEIKQFLAEDEK